MSRWEPTSQRLLPRLKRISEWGFYQCSYFHMLITQTVDLQTYLGGKKNHFTFDSALKVILMAPRLSAPRCLALTRKFLPPQRARVNLRLQRPPNHQNQMYLLRVSLQLTILVITSRVRVRLLLLKCIRPIQPRLANHLAVSGTTLLEQQALWVAMFASAVLLAMISVAKQH